MVLPSIGGGVEFIAEFLGPLVDARSFGFEICSVRLPLAFSKIQFVMSLLKRVHLASLNCEIGLGGVDAASQTTEPSFNVKEFEKIFDERHGALRPGNVTVTKCNRLSRTITWRM